MISWKTALCYGACGIHPAWLRRIHKDDQTELVVKALGGVCAFELHRVAGSGPRCLTRRLSMQLYAR